MEAGRVRCRTIEHRHPEDAPTEDTEDGNQIDQSVGGPELRFLCFAAGFQDFVKCFDFPARGIPLEFFDRLKRRGNRQIRDQFPIDRITSGWGFAFLSINDGQSQFRISALFTDRRKNTDTAVSDLQIRLPSAVPFCLGR